MILFGLLLAWCAGAPAAGESPAPVRQEAAAEPLAAVALEQDGRSYTVREVLAAAARRDPSLVTALERDPAYRRLYLASPQFLRQVQAFSDWLLVEQAGLAPATEAQLLAEAAAWSADRGLSTPPAGALLSHALEIETRARLLAELPEEIPTAELRDHMLESVPEFFGELACSILRRPLVDATTGAALTVERRRELYDEFDALAKDLEAQRIRWDQAVERYALNPLERQRKGYIGLISRTMVERFEEPFLRHAFAGLGFKAPAGQLLRGPILGDRWIYLVRIESVHTRGVVELERVRQRVDRSYREEKLQERLGGLRGAARIRFLAPVIEPAGAPAAAAEGGAAPK